MSRRYATIEERIKINIKITNKDCWEWKLRLTGDGYARTTVNNKSILVHRLSYEIFIGKIPHGLELDHLCRNRACVNPSHLEPVTGLENNYRGHGFAAKNKRKTHCIRGHELSGENLYKRAPLFARECRICVMSNSRKQRVKNRLRKIPTIVKGDICSKSIVVAPNAEFVLLYT